MAGEQIMSLVSKTIGTILRERAEKTPDCPGIGYRDYLYSWKEMDEISDFLAVRYLELGIRKGSHAAIWSVNSPNWVFCFFALLKIGAAAVLVNTCYKENELEEILRDNDIEYLFHGYGCKSTVYEDLLKKIPVENLPYLKKIVPLEEDPANKWYQRAGFPLELSGREKKKLDERKAEVMPEDTACIMFTSGTTSRPKGVMLSHFSLVNNSAEIARQMHWSQKDKLCISVPLFHCFGITAGILCCIHSGAQAHLLKYYKTVDVLEQVEKYRCTVLNGVPTMFLAILHNQNRSQYDLSSLKSGIIAGSPVLPVEYQEICRELGMKHLQVSYGQTEASPCIAISDYEDSLELKSHTAGRPIPDIEFAVQQSDVIRNESMDGCRKEVCGRYAGICGEIVVRGYNVMQGYYKRPEETKAALDPDGWLHTGDLGYVDENGCLHVTGRMKEMIIRSGENISPAEIENCIIEMPEVEEVKVIGIPAKVLQEEIAACIIPKNGAVIDEEKVRSYVKSRLSDYKVPKYVLTFQNFPINASGKVLSRELRVQAGEMINLKH